MKGPAGCDRMIEFKTYLLALHRASSWWFQIFFIFRSHFGSSFFSIGSPCIGCENQLQLRMQPRKSQGPQPPQMVLAYPGRPQTFTVPMSYSTMLPSAQAMRTTSSSSHTYIQQPVQEVDRMEPQKARAMLRGFIQQSAKVESRVRAIEAQLQASEAKKEEQKSAGGEAEVVENQFSQAEGTELPPLQTTGCFCGWLAHLGHLPL